MPEITVQLFSLLPRQYEIISHPSRFRVLACGRRFGKTETAIHEMSVRAIRGERVAYFAPTYKMTTETFRHLLARLAPVIVYSSKTDARIQLITGGVIECWSLSTTSAESVRGRKYHFAVIDEAAMVINGMTVWQEVIRPLLVDYRGGAFFCSTPKGMNWFYQLYQWGLDNTLPDWHSWNYPTAANPLIPPEEIEEARQTSVKRSFDQEYLATFNEDSGTVFRNLNAVCRLSPAPGIEVGHVYIAGVDWGRDLDFTVISVWDATAKKQVWLDRFNQIGWAFQRGRIREICNAWRIQYLLVEENSIGSVNLEALQMEGLPAYGFMTTTASKAPLIEGLALAIERDEIAMLNDATQLHEMKAYQSYRHGSGSYGYSAPVGGHDDTVIAAALGYYAIMAGLHAPRLDQMPVNW